MKKLLFILCLLIGTSLLPLSLFAQTPTISITLNHVTFTPQYTPFIRDNLLYISGEDLANMTYGSFTTKDTVVSLKIQDATLTYDQSTGTYTFNQKKYVDRKPLFETDEHIAYFPVRLLKLFNYSFEYQDRHLTLNALMPYSTATDNYDSHHLLTTTYTSYESLLEPLLKADEAASLIKEAKNNHQYFSFITTENKQECLAALKKLKKDEIKLTLHLRQLNTAHDTPCVSNFTTYPVDYTLTGDDLKIQIGAKELTANCFWSAYTPLNKKVAIDLEKSLDVMLMRTFYEYYRNAFDLKDNLSIKPITTITYGRSDSMTYDVYLENDTSKKIYQVILYKQSTAHSVDYYVDFIAA